MELAGAQYDTFDIPIHEIWDDYDFNCRDGINRQSIEDLAQSIEQEGLLFPIDVRPAAECEDCPPGFKYSLVCGFRRIRATKLLEWTKIPARVRTGLSERQAQLMNLTENLERKDLNILEEAKALDRLFPPYRSISSIAKELKKTEAWVYTRRALICQCDLIKQAAASGRLSQTDIAMLVKHPNAEKKAREILAVKKGRKTRTYHKGKYRRTKTEIKGLVTRLLAEGFHPKLLRFFSWTLGDCSDEDLEDSLRWLRDKKGWLKDDTRS